MIYTFILLAVWFGLWVYKYFPRLRYKSWLKDKLKGVQLAIWDYEFKKFKSLQIREEIRLTYDNLKQQLVLLKQRIEDANAGKLKMEKGDIARLDDDKVRMELQLKQYEDQMKGIDTDVFGAPKSNENPDGLRGLEHSIDELQELKSLIKKDLKR